MNVQLERNQRENELELTEFHTESENAPVSCPWLSPGRPVPQVSVGHGSNPCGQIEGVSLCCLPADPPSFFSLLVSSLSLDSHSEKFILEDSFHSTQIHSYRQMAEMDLPVMSRQDRLYRNQSQVPVTTVDSQLFAQQNPADSGWFCHCEKTLGVVDVD